MFDTTLRARPNQSLSLDEMRQQLPAIFAKQPHASRSDRYVYISTERLLNGLTEVGFMPVEARVSKARIADHQEYAKHMIRFRHRGDLGTAPEQRRVGDTSFEVIMRNAHDGSSTYQFMAGLLKLLCLNGLVVSEGTVADVKIKHIGNPDQQIAAVVDGIDQVLNKGPQVINTIKQWQGIDLSQDERMVLAEAAREVRFADAEGQVKTPITAQQLLLPRRPADQGNSLWTTFNVIQENVMRGGLTALGTTADGQPRRATSRRVNGIDADIKLNRALWRLSERMAELKQ